MTASLERIAFSASQHIPDIKDIISDAHDRNRSRSPIVSRDEESRIRGTRLAPPRREISEASIRSSTRRESGSPSSRRNKGRSASSSLDYVRPDRRRYSSSQLATTEHRTPSRSYSGDFQRPQHRYESTDNPNERQGDFGSTWRRRSKRRSSGSERRRPRSKSPKSSKFQRESHEYSLPRRRSKNELSSSRHSTNRTRSYERRRSRSKSPGRKISESRRRSRSPISKSHHVSSSIRSRSRNENERRKHELFSSSSHRPPPIRSSSRRRSNRSRSDDRRRKSRSRSPHPSHHRSPSRSPSHERRISRSRSPARSRRRQEPSSSPDRDRYSSRRSRSHSDERRRNRSRSPPVSTPRQRDVLSSSTHRPSNTRSSARRSSTSYSNERRRDHRSKSPISTDHKSASRRSRNHSDERGNNRSRSPEDDRRRSDDLSSLRHRSEHGSSSRYSSKGHSNQGREKRSKSPSSGGKSESFELLKLPSNSRDRPHRRSKPKNDASSKVERSVPNLQEKKDLRRSTSWSGSRRKSTVEEEPKEDVALISKRGIPKRSSSMSIKSGEGNPGPRRSLGRSEHGGLERRSLRRGSVEVARKKDRLSQSEHITSSKHKAERGSITNVSSKGNRPSVILSMTSPSSDDDVHEAKLDPLPENTFNSVSLSRRTHMARGRNNMLRSLEAAYQSAQADKEQQVHIASLREKLEDTKQQWINTRIERDEEIETLRKDLNSRKEVLMQAHIAAIENSRKKEFAFNMEVLQEENDALKQELATLSTSMDEAKEENHKLEATKLQLAEMIENVTKAEPLDGNDPEEMTEDEQTIRVTVEKVGKILNSITGLKNVYRRNMYKCLDAVSFSEYYDHFLYTEIEEEVQQCEGLLGSDFVDHRGQDYLQLADADEESDNHEGSVDAECDNPKAAAKDGGDEHFDVSEVTRQAEELAEELLSKISKLLQEEEISSLYENKYVVSGIFVLLDKDGGGTIDPDEFRKGLEVLNRRLSPAAQFQNSDELFNAIDVDGSGEIDVEEFEAFFALNSILAAKKKKKKKRKKKKAPVDEEANEGAPKDADLADQPLISKDAPPEETTDLDDDESLKKVDTEKSPDDEDSNEDLRENVDLTDDSQISKSNALSDAPATTDFVVAASMKKKKKKTTAGRPSNDTSLASVAVYRW